MRKLQEQHNNSTNYETDVGYDYGGFIVFIKFLGLFSMIASTFIGRDIYYRLRRVTRSTAGVTSWRQKVSLTQSILFLLSIGDFFSAFFVQFLSTWMVPSFIPVSFASGTVGSCTTQGVFGYFFYSLSAGSNASLAVAYCLIVRFGWKEDDKDRKRLPFVLIPILIATVIALIPLWGQHYNYNGSFFCDITPSPYSCKYPDSEVTCTRGLHARQFLLYLGVIPVMVAFVIIIAAVGVLIYSVFKQEQRMDRYQRQGMSHNRQMTNQTARQGMYYIGAFAIVWIPWYVFALLEYSQNVAMSEALAVVHLVTMPWQGVLNSLVYFRPRYKSDRASKPMESRISSVLRVLRITLPESKCCTSKKLQQKSEGTKKDTTTAMQPVEEVTNGNQKKESEEKMSNEEGLH